MQGVTAGRWLLWQTCRETRFVFPTPEGEAVPNQCRKHPYRVSGLKFFLLPSSLYISINILHLHFTLVCFWSQIMLESAKVQISAAAVQSVSNWMRGTKGRRVSHNATGKNDGPKCTFCLIKWAEENLCSVTDTCLRLSAVWLLGFVRSWCSAVQHWVWDAWRSKEKR